MKKCIFTIFLLTISIGTYAQRKNGTVVQGNGENLRKNEVKSLLNPKTTIELQIVTQDKSTLSNIRIYITELDEVYGCDSLGNFHIALPDSLSKLDQVHFTIIKRERINDKQIKLYTRKINSPINHMINKRKIVLLNYKKVKAYSCTITPSF